MAEKAKKDEIPNSHSRGNLTILMNIFNKGTVGNIYEGEMSMLTYIF